MTLILKNPHSILAVMRSRPSDIKSLSLPQNGGGSAWEEVAKAASHINIKAQATKKQKVPQGHRSKNQPKTGREGGGEAQVREKDGLNLDAIFTTTDQSDSEKYGLWLALDRLQDPHNIGAIFRSAAFFGVRGIILPRDQNAPISSVVYDVATGGVEHVPFARITNLARGLDAAKDAGLWILGTSEHSRTSISEISHDRNWLLVIGNEAKGIRRLTEERCDMLCSIGGSGPVGSLNASVAAGILIANLI